MSTRSKSPTDIYDAGAEFDDDPTVIDGDQITPVELPRCAECGRVVFHDDFTDVSASIAYGLFSADRCVRGTRWHWCGETWRLVYVPPRP